ncbi:MAG: C39 family peptidase [Lachnospiraceae bacterium]|nr:C39 family peptidase [Lachnospiraceae bacterium]
MNNFDFGYKGVFVSGRKSTDHNTYFKKKGINISDCSNDQIRDAIKHGYLKKRMLSREEIKRLESIIAEREAAKSAHTAAYKGYQYSGNPYTSGGYSADKEQIVRNAQSWFSKRHSEAESRMVQYGIDESTPYSPNNTSYSQYVSDTAITRPSYEESFSASQAATQTEQQAAYFEYRKDIRQKGSIGNKRPIGDQGFHQISEKVSVISQGSLISDKVRVVNKDGIPVKGQTGMKAQFLKGKGKKEVYKTLARKRAVKKAGIRYYKRSRLKKKGLMRLIPNGMKKSIGIPFLLAGSAATAACGVMIPFSSVPLLNPNSAITNDHLSIDDTPLQQGINYTEEYLLAYEENIFNYEPGSERSSIGIPKPWVLDDVMTTKEEEQMVHKDPTAFYGEAEFVNEEGIVGYDLRQYWDPKSFLYKTAVTCTCDACKGGDPKGHGKSYKVILKGTAGLRGDASSDGTLYGEGGEGWSGDVYEGYISEGSETYDNRTPEDCEYRETHKYQGSMYSEYRTRKEYEPLEKLRTSRVYIQGTPKEDPTEGIGNAANSVVDNTKMARDTYYPTQLIDYTKTQMYHAFAVMAIGISHNFDECRKFFKKYMKKTYDLECNYAVLTLKTYPQSDESNLVNERDYDNGHGERFSPVLRGEKDKITFNIELPCGTVKEFVEIDHSYKARGFLNIEYKYCSIQDLVRLEEEDVDWVEKTTNEWLHREDNHETVEEMEEYGQGVLKESDVYSITDKSNKRYKYWYDYNDENVWIGWFTKKENGIRSAYLDHSMNHYELTDDDWAYAYPELTWPQGETDNFEETRLKQYRKPKAKEVMEPLDIAALTDLLPEGVLPPEFLYPDVDGSTILKMYMYLNQGDFANIIRGASSESVKKSGCLDCSIAMIAMYYTRQNIPIQAVSRFANKEGQLDAGAALAQFGLRQGGNVYGNFANGVINEINSGRPPIVHIRGFWKSADGNVLHGSKNGHFLVATGYDKTGIYVYDPGKRANHHISYRDWATAHDLYYRPVHRR